MPMGKIYNSTKSLVVHQDKEVKKLKKKVNILIRGVDERYLFNILTGTSISSTMSVQLLNGIGQGDDVGERESNDVLMTHLTLRQNFIVGDTTNTIRTLLVYDKQANGAVFTDTQLFQNYTSATILAPLTDFRADYKTRFTILYDKTFVLTNVGSNLCVVKIKHLRLNKKVNYVAGTSAVTSIGRGALYLVYISDSTAPTHPTFSSSISVFYTG